MYFTKGSEFWVIHPLGRPSVNREYPLPLSDLKLPADLDSAFQKEDGEIYFFKNGEYWTYKDENPHPTELDPFSRNTGEDWFGCSEISISNDYDEGSEASEENLGDQPATVHNPKLRSCRKDCTRVYFQKVDAYHCVKDGYIGKYSKPKLYKNRGQTFC